MKMKDFVENCPDDMKNKDYFRAPIAFGHTVDDYGHEPPTLPQLVSEDKDVRLLASKIVIDKFNEKYSELTGSLA